MCIVDGRRYEARVPGLFNSIHFDRPIEDTSNTLACMSFPTISESGEFVKFG
jgi:hypothetical protein